jgi:cellulose synthase/poly-beta-1,6-N-acetylglucosamine synthase-like glycosyltransferase
MTEPAVTALIATYRAGDYLRQAIASALDQTHTDLEVLVSDDANDPDVLRLTQSFGDPRIRYRSNPVRLGPARNHWAALVAARGRYVSILNHDDVWRPAFLATAVPILEDSPEAVLVFCDHDVIDSSGRSIPGEADRTARMWGRDRLTRGLYGTFPDLVARQTIPLAMGCLFRRETIDAHSLPDVGPAYDLWLTLALCRTGGSAYYLADRLTAWRIHAAQLTAALDPEWTRGALACWQAMDGDAAFRPVQNTVKWGVSRMAASLGIRHLTARNRAAARSAAWLALRARPLNWLAWGVLGLTLLPRVIGNRVFRRDSLSTGVPA